MEISGHIGIIAHPEKDKAKEFAPFLQDWFIKRGRSCDIISGMKRVSGRYGLIAVLGGDGLFMSVASRLVSLGAVTPVLGINFGDQGFLTLADAKADAEGKTWQDILTRVLEGDFIIEERLVLQVVHAGKKYFAVNDAVIRHPDGMVILESEVDGCVHYEELAADGVIVATPAGSPAYNKSAGGPLIMPTANCFVVTPMEPMDFHGKPAGLPLIADPRSEVLIRVVERKPSRGRWLPQLKVDGKRCPPALEAGDCVTVSGCDMRSRRVSFGPQSFFDAIRLKTGRR